MHLLSSCETSAALLALYHPSVWDVKEQKLLSTTPAQHPLATHPEAVALVLQPLRGTVDVMDRMGVLKRHPVVLLKETDNWKRVPFNYIGDLLLFLADEAGLYVVNWTVKATQAAFKRPGPCRRIPHTGEDDAAAELRHLIEEIYYSDAGIRTVRISGDLINLDVIYNLTDLFQSHARTLDVSETIKAGVLSRFRDSIGTGIPAYKLISQITRDYDINFEAARVILKQGIWSRDLRVDLYHPILMDRPLRTEERDVIDEYSDWFTK